MDKVISGQLPSMMGKGGLKKIKELKTAVTSISQALKIIDKIAKCNIENNGNVLLPLKA